MVYIIFLTLLPQLWFPFLDSGKYEVSTPSCRQTVQSTTNTLHSNYVQVFASCIVSTVHNSTHWHSQ